MTINETPVIPVKEVYARALAPSFMDDDGWADRDANSKAMVALSGAAERLGGLSQICFQLCLSEGNSGSNRGSKLHSPYYFLAVALEDLARGLKAAHRIYWDDATAKEEAASKSARKKPMRKALAQRK